MMVRATAIVLVLAGPALAGEGQALQLSIINRTPDLLECEALAAHWFNLPLGTRAAGGAFTLDMAFDPATGTLTVAGPTGEAMAIEVVFCGAAGRAWETAHQLPLRRLAAAALAGGGRLAVSCRQDGLRPVCD